MTKKENFYLTNACKRCTIRLLPMAVKIQHGNKVIYCDTAQEAAELLKKLAEEDRYKASRPLEELAMMLNPWTERVFWKFIDSLGEPQIKALKALLAKTKMSDRDLRKVLKVKNNQQLAGILSGISKQAASVNIKARNVYKIETELVKGKKEKYYVVSRGFFNVSNDMNWPDG